MSALAERAVACKGWRWMPGMLDLAEDGDCRVVRVTTDDGHSGQFLDFTWPDEDALEDGGLVLSSEYGPHGTFLPDLDDPATLGCLLALVREAWVCPGAYARESGKGGWVVCVRNLDPNGPVFAGPFRGPTEAEALTVALESAP